MRICFICPEYPEGPHGGIGTMVQIISRELAFRGHEIRVIGIYPLNYPAPDFEIDKNVKVWRLRKKKGKFGWVVPFIRQYNIIKEWAKNDEIDIVEAPDSRGWISFWPNLPIPVILRAHGSNTYIAKILGKKPNRLTHFLELTSYKRADALISVSKFSAIQTTKTFSLKKNFTIIYNGIDIPSFSKNPRRKENLIVFSGSITKNKGVYELIEAFILLLNERPNSHLYLYGKDTISQECGSVINFIINQIPNHYKSNIHFMGHVSRDKLFEAYREASIAIFPSYVESFSMAPMESMVCECPTIYTEFGSGNEIIDNGVDGLLVNPRSPSDIKEKMMFLLENPSIANTIGERGRKKIETNFSKSKMVEITLDFYRAITNNPLA